MQAKSSFYPEDRTFYVNAPHHAQTAHSKFDPSITKQDFPDMKTRGRVLENRVDLDLEREGNILAGGRNEQAVMAAKRDAEQRLMRDELQK